jgi:hypothetical protein
MTDHAMALASGRTAEPEASCVPAVTNFCYPASYYSSTLTLARKEPAKAGDYPAVPRD